MAKNIIICGVGGQGTVLAAKVLSQAAISNGERVLSAGNCVGMISRIWLIPHMTIAAMEMKIRFSSSSEFDPRCFPMERYRVDATIREIPPQEYQVSRCDQKKILHKNGRRNDI